MKDKNQKNINFSTKEDIELFEKITKYCSLTNTKKTELVRNHFKNLLKDTVLNNDYITLKEPLYFNIETLIKKGTVKASKEKPFFNLSNMAKVIKIPNNLDKFNPDFKTYCYENNKNNHLGIEYYKIMEDIKPSYLIFRYNNKSLEVGILEGHLLKQLLNPMEYKEDIKKLKTNDIKGLITFKENKYTFISPYIIDIETLSNIENYILKVSNTFIKIFELIQKILLINKQNKEYFKESEKEVNNYKKQLKELKKELDLKKASDKVNNKEVDKLELNINDISQKIINIGNKADNINTEWNNKETEINEGIELKFKELNELESNKVRAKLLNVSESEFKNNIGFYSKIISIYENNNNYTAYYEDLLYLVYDKEYSKENTPSETKINNMLLKCEKVINLKYNF